ncbi:MAG: nitroreductase [Colwellia sp.]|jgi:nitroreductase
MSLTAILEKRHSVRAFLDTPVKQERLSTIFAQAQSAPSNCNVQPWQTCVVSGAKKESLKDELITTVMSERHQILTLIGYLNMKAFIETDSLVQPMHFIARLVLLDKTKKAAR